MCACTCLLRHQHSCSTGSSARPAGTPHLHNFPACVMCKQRRRPEQRGGGFNPTRCTLCSTWTFEMCHSGTQVHQYRSCGASQQHMGIYLSVYVRICTHLEHNHAGTGIIVANKSCSFISSEPRRHGYAPRKIRVYSYPFCK